MSEKSIAEKLLVKAGFTVCLLHAPEKNEALIGKLPDGVTVKRELIGPLDLI